MNLNSSNRKWQWLPSASLVLLLGILGACTSISNPNRQVETDYSPTLLTGESVFGEEVSADEVASVDIVAISESMQTYLQENVGDRRLAVARFKLMFGSLSRDGYFRTTYDIGSTHTAQETFATKNGNCLSYTNLFIALAREVGIDARYQVVKVPPSWDADSGYIIRYTHVNVLIRGVYLDNIHGDEFSLDFNNVLPEPEYPRYTVSDDYATSLFYANRSIDLTRNGEIRAGFAYLRKAIEMSPSNSDLWINLGAFYNKQGDSVSALGAFDVALQIDPNSRSAMSGLARTHANLGQNAEATLYAGQVRRYREKNPYYHFAIAQSEFEEAQYQQALDAINVAIRLKRGNGRFYFLKGLTEQKLGDSTSAQASFRRAERYGSYLDLKKRYYSELVGITVIEKG